MTRTTICFQSAEILQAVLDDQSSAPRTDSDEAVTATREALVRVRALIERP